MANEKLDIVDHALLWILIVSVAAGIVGLPAALVGFLLYFVYP